jgi:uncharacterized protein YkwD
MSPRRVPFLVAVPLTALALAGCGSAGRTAGDASHHAAGTPHAPATSLRVAATDLRLGDATAADGRSGLHRLQAGGRIAPDALRSGARDRAGVGAAAGCADADVQPAADNLATVAAATLCLLNAERADAGLAPLTLNDRLAEAATEHTRDMVDHQYFAHVTPDGVDLVARVKPTSYIRSDMSWIVGENLAWGTGPLATPRNIVAAWMASPGHRENVLRPVFREIGFGVSTGNPRATDGAGATYTTVFGTIGDPEAATELEVKPVAARKAVTRRAAARRKARIARRKGHFAGRKVGIAEARKVAGRKVGRATARKEAGRKVGIAEARKPAGRKVGRADLG